MKNKLIYLLIFFISFTSFAQKVSIKKDEVLLDKTPIANLKDIGSTYIFANLTDVENPVFKVKFNSLKISDEVSKNWLTISYPDESKTTEIEMEYLSFTMSGKKGVAELLMKKYNILTPSGIDKAAFDSFMAIERPSLTNEYNGLLKGEVTKQRAIANVDVSIDADYRRIFKGSVPYTSSTLDNILRESGTYENLLGTYLINGQNRTVDVYDLDNKKVALASISMFDEVKVILPYTKQEFTYKSKKRFDVSNKYYQEEFMKELIGNLHLRGVALGHQVRDEREMEIAAKREIAKENYEIAKANSSNIYKKPGYVIDDKGEKWEGNISIMFEKIEDPNDPFKNVEELSNNTGKIVGIEYQNEKSKTKYKSFKSKDNIKFCVKNEDGSETCYQGMAVKGKGVELAAGAVSSLSFDTSLFYQVVEELENISLYREIPGGKFIIKNKNEKKGYQFNITNKEKDIEKLSEYIGNCPITNQLGGYDFSSLEELKKFINSYNNTCK